MSLLDVIADLSGLTTAVNDNTRVLTRIAEALERISPPLPAADHLSPAAATASARGQGVQEHPPVFHLSESPEEYQERVNSEAALAISLGVAPWSPAFQQSILEMRQELLKPRMELNEEGERIEAAPYSEAEADAIIRDAFQLAKAEANARLGTIRTG